MVWYGMVWLVCCGIVGVVWYGVVWYGWYGAVWCGIVWYGSSYSSSILILFRQCRTDFHHGYTRFTLPPILNMGSSFSTSLPAFIVIVFP